MKTCKSSLTVRNIVASIISALSIALFVWWGMNFPGPAPTIAWGRNTSHTNTDVHAFHFSGTFDHTHTNSLRLADAIPV